MSDTLSKCPPTLGRSLDEQLPKGSRKHYFVFLLAMIFSGEFEYPYLFSINHFICRLKSETF